MTKEIHIKLTFLLLLLAVLFYDTFPYLLYQWNQGDNNYCYLIPLVAAYLIYEKRAELNAIPDAPSWKGLLAFIPGIALYWFGELAGEYYTLYLSMWLIFTGSLWMLLGWEKIRIMGFALMMLLAMFPLPNFFHTRLSLQLKLLSSKLGVMLMHAMGLSAYRTGNVIDLGFTQLQVVDACSGLRYFFPMIIMGLLIAYFSKGALWKKITIVISTIPLVVVANGIRIAATGFLYQYFGKTVTDGAFHDVSGFIMFIASVALLIPEMWVLNRLFPEKESDRDTKKSSCKQMGIEKPTSDKSHTCWSRLFMPPQFAVAGTVIAVILVLSHGIEFREKIPIKKSFDSFPMKIDEWTGTKGVMGQRFIDALDFSDYLLADYVNPRGEVINFYVAYYETQRKGESIHSPTTCLTGGGWIFKDRQEVELHIPGRKPFPVQRALIQQNGTRQVTYYWFPMRGRVLANAYQMKLYNFLDALILHRTDGALVRVMTPLGPEETEADGDARIQHFLEKALPVLDQYLPE